MLKEPLIITHKRIKDLPNFDRPREKLVQRGVEALSDTELLAILLGSGSKKRTVLELAAAILTRIDHRIDQLTVAALQEVDGVGQAKACQIVAALEFARRYLSNRRTVISKPADILPFINHIAAKKQEYFICVSLNGANEIIASRVVTVGLLTSNQVHPREVFADPIVDRAAAVILAHNHPSGTLKPSDDDIQVTQRLIKSGKILGIEVLDHIIVTQDGHISLLQNSAVA
ncbi:DNA repair protein RadC [Candidatus Acetothermia bacterium]|nr:DNA repair protein RadC [Candidatus Acetothermia bacterium]MCI2426773.1 DNA repair protein RadC [Candidatus Acetothermia bacterium]MCI2427433.1 DNA repair protein RadC [Candidatus Acetothermia bacterium]MCI2428504.1 DNA repair protein RadC [Candidatus Acetothermia bacterium]